MTDTTLLIKVDPRGVAEVTINRPEVLNAFDEALIGHSSETFERLAADFLQSSGPTLSMRSAFVKPDASR